MIICKKLLKKIFSIFIFIALSTTILAQEKWIDAIVVYKNLSIDSCKVKIRKNNFYSSVKILKDNKKKNIFPSEVKTIETAKEKYISIYFDSINYGKSSYSFAKIIKEFDYLLLWTKFKEKTCSCQKYGAIERGYFLYYSENEILRIYSDISNNILNRNEMIKFTEEKSKNINFDNIKKITDI